MINLKKYILKKETKEKIIIFLKNIPIDKNVNNPNRIHESGKHLSFFSKILNKDIPIYINNKNVFESISKIIIKNNYSISYTKRIIRLFENFFHFLEKKKFKSIKKIEKIIGNVIFSIKRINISDIYSFIKEKKCYKKQSSINWILSTFRKFTRLLNGEPKLNYKEKIKFSPKTKRNDLSLEEQSLIIKFFKEKNDIQSMLIFYFLYYLDLTYTSISRCTLKHFKYGLSILKVRKEKLRKYIIISIIKGIIRNFLKEKKNESLYLFQMISQE